MTESLDKTYEQLKAYVANLGAASSPTERDIGFADEEQSIALARDQDGRIEAFLVGERLNASLGPVERAMEYRDDWQSSNEGALRANQLVLPRDVYFDSAAALICVELIDAGYHADPQAAFAQVEPLIERFIRGGDQIGDQILVGLYGEMLLVDALTKRVRPAEVDDVVDAWFGWRPSSRDFQLGAVGVEVKTTLGSTSRHHIQGFHQVELGYPVTDVAETSLYLLSIGVLSIPMDQRSGQSVPSLVEQILQKLATSASQTRFLDRVQAYGGDTGLGYKHTRDRGMSRFQKRFSSTFERLYDLTDDGLRIPHRSDLETFSHIDLDSIEFTIDLPFPFKGVINPTSGLDSILERLLA